MMKKTKELPVYVYIKGDVWIVQDGRNVISEHREKFSALRKAHDIAEVKRRIIKLYQKDGSYTTFKTPYGPLKLADALYPY